MDNEEMIKVVNRHTHDGPEQSEIDIYVGRSTIWGNPYGRSEKSPIVVDSREEAIEKYKQYLYEKLKDEDNELYKHFRGLKQLVQIGHNVNLVCSCAPKKCHADVIKEIINKWIQAES